MIKKINLSFTGSLSPRKKTSYIVLHHRAGEGDAQSIHKSHLALGWAGIGYHLYIRKDGSVFEGRPLDTVGAHTAGKNSESVGVCFEGNFENDKMSAAQINAGIKIVEFLMEKFPNATLVRHCDLGATLCPGKNFPFEEIKRGHSKKEEKAEKTKLESANDITWELKQKIEILDTDNFVSALEKARAENSPLYWGYYKIVNGK